MHQHFTKRLLVTFVVLGGLFAARLPAEPRAFEGLDRYIKQAMADWQVPGLAIVVVHHDAVVYSRAFGVREAGKPAPVDLDTVFALSSNGKAFAATAAGILVDEGKLRWDDHAADYLDYFRLPDPWATQTVTIRDLLSHRLADDLGVDSDALWSYTALGREEVLRRLRYLDTGPRRLRSEFEYNNPNISAAGQIAGAVAGTTWDEFVKTRLLVPLGMRSATVSARELWNDGDLAVCYMCDLDRTPGYERAKIANIAMPHITTPAGPKAIPWRTVDNIAPAGSINANVLDFAKFMRLHLNQGVFEGRRLLSEVTVAELHTPQMLVRAPPYPAGAGFGKFWGYGLGWFVTEYRGRKTVMHSGGITGWRSAIVMLPEEHLGVAVVSNNNTVIHGSDDKLAPALGFVVLDRVLGFPRVDRSAEWLAFVNATRARAQTADQALRAQIDPGARPSFGLDQLSGSYWNPAFGELIVDAAGNRVRLAGVMQGQLEHWHHDLYRVAWTSPSPTATFLRIEAARDGTVGAVRVEGFGAFTPRTRR